MVETATELTRSDLDEVQKPIMFDYQKKVDETSRGDLGIPQLNDDDCIIIREHSNSVDALATNPVNQNEFITGSHDQTIRIWDANKSKCTKVLKGNAQGIWNLNYTKNGKNFVSASPDGVCKMWDARSGKEVSKYHGHKDRCYKAMLSNDDKMMASCGSDKMICVWDLRKAAKPVLVNTESASCIMACDWAADGKHVVSTTQDGMINSLNVESNKMVLFHNTLELQPETPSNIIYACKQVKNSPYSGNIFAIGAENKVCHVLEYDPSAKYESWLVEIKQKYEGHSAGIRDMSFSPDCRRLLTGCEDHSVRMWNPQTCEPICLFAGHTDFVTGVSFLNSRTVVSTSWDTRIRLWNVPEEFMS